MRKSTKMLKKLACLFLVVLMSIESFAAVVSDGDGAAFVTKAEFEALKENFAEQIEDYNASIDSKIDGAIASYLAGINVLKMVKISPFLSGPVYAFEAANSATGRMRYVYNPPAFIGKPRNVEFSWDPGWYGNAAMYEFVFKDDVDHNQKDWWQTKLTISDIDETKRIAAWRGRRTGAYDELDVTYTKLNYDTVNWGVPQAVTQIIKGDDTTYNTRILTNVDLYGQGLLEAYTAPVKNSNSNNILLFFLNRVLNHWGTLHNENVILCGNTYAYDCFSNYDTNRNYKYNGTSETLSQRINTHTDILRGIADGLFKGNTTLSGTFANGHTVSDRVPIGGATKQTMTTTVLGDVFYHSGRISQSFAIGDTWYWPTVGFERTYITNWDQLYLPNLDIVAKSMVADSIKGYTALMQSTDGNYHVPITAGLPLVQVKNESRVELPFEVYTYNLDTNASSSTYGQETRTTPGRTYIWAKTSPFTTNDPNSEADITITTGNGVNKSTDTAYNKGVYITSSKATLKFDEINETCYIWLKWSTNNKLGNGVVIIPEQISISQ